MKTRSLRWQTTRRPTGTSLRMKRKMDKNINLTQYTIRSIETVLEKGDRVELIPVKDGVKVIHIKRKVVTEDKK